MNKPAEDWLESDHQTETCESCPFPEGCIRECVIENYVHEEVAKIRNEESA